MSTIHQFKIKQLEGNDLIDFADYRGKKILVVNVASECGFTPQYQQLQELYSTFQDKLVVIGVPSNDFGGQEPGSDKEIKEFCELRYGVSFPLASKQTIKGSDITPLYKWLTQKELNGLDDFELSWNFNKFLIDESGNIIDFYSSSVSPFDDKIISQL
ncbi:MAG: glutathione peroxidase [Bacteroidota bacterium]